MSEMYIKLCNDVSYIIFAGVGINYAIIKGATLTDHKKNAPIVLALIATILCFIVTPTTASGLELEGIQITFGRHHGYDAPSPPPPPAPHHHMHMPPPPPQAHFHGGYGGQHMWAQRPQPPTPPRGHMPPPPPGHYR